MLRGIDELKVELDAGSSRREAGFLLCIVKISQGLRKFRNHSENFAIIVKIRYHSENYKFSLCTVIFAMIAKFRYHSEIFAMIAKFTA